MINKKIYIGIHQTNNPYDSYLGSGKIIKRAIKKYGKENFSKEILYIFHNKEDMVEKEFEIVNEDFVEDENTYNITNGGKYSGVYGNNGKPGFGGENLISGAILKERLIENGKWEEHKLHISSSLKKYYKHNENGFKGKKHTRETKNKIGKANSKHQKGKGNSQYGTVWIYCPYTHINKKYKNQNYSNGKMMDG